MPWSHPDHQASAEEAVARGLISGDPKVLANTPEPAQSSDHASRVIGLTILNAVSVGKVDSRYVWKPGQWTPPPVEPPPVEPPPVEPPPVEPPSGEYSIPEIGYVPPTQLYTGPSVITSRNIELVGLRFEEPITLFSPTQTFDSFTIRGCLFEDVVAPGKNLRIMSAAPPGIGGQVRGCLFRSGGADCVSSNGAEGPVHIEVCENLFTELDAPDAHTDHVVINNGYQHVHHNRWHRIGRFSSAIFFQGFNGPVWGTVEHNHIDTNDDVPGDNHLIRAQGRQGNLTLAITDNYLDGDVSWIDPTWEGFLVWERNGPAGFVYHAA